MNDFTLEELHEIHGAVEDTLVAMSSHLADKIQSMIDGYCEHESDQGGTGGDFLYTCKKCQELYR